MKNTPYTPNTAEVCGWYVQAMQDYPGMEADEAIRRLSGIKCGFKSTSCPDQLAYALQAYLNQR